MSIEQREIFEDVGGNGVAGLNNNIVEKNSK